MTLTDVRRSDQTGWRRNRHYAVGLLLCGLVLIIVRLHAFALPLETDECNYAYIGDRLLHGDRMYVDVWDHQPPGIFVLFAAVQTMFGGEPNVFRTIALVFSLASMGFIAALLRRLAGAWAGLLGAFLFALSSSDPGTAGEGCNREIFMNTLVLLAWWSVRRWSSTRSSAGVLIAGVALGLASTIKTIIAVHWALLLIWLVTTTPVVSHSRRDRFRAALARTCWFAVGPTLTWCGVGLYFNLTGRGYEFIDAVFAANLSYIEQSESFFARFTDFFKLKSHPATFDSAIALWGGSAIAVVWLGWRAARGVQRWDALLVLFLLLSGYVAVCLPAQFWPHYYYLMIPPAIVAAAYVVGDIGQVWRLSAQEQGTRSLKDISTVIACLLAAIIIGSTAYTQHRDYFSQPPAEITWKRYITRDFWGRAQGENVARVTSPEDTIFVYGNDASIYYYSGRRCASRFTMVTGLREGYRGAERRRELLLDDMRRNRPVLVILTFDEKPFAAWRAYLDEYYSPEPIAWDFNDCTDAPIMAVLSRRDVQLAEIDWNWDRRSIGGRCPDVPKSPVREK